MAYGRTGGQIAMMTIACAILIAVSAFLLLDVSLIRHVLGLVLLGNTINVILLLTGGLNNQLPVFIGSGSPEKFANPLPQALILTAIVISFGLLAFLSVLLWKLKQTKPERADGS
jgi:multicomponent Na+:H+ antiporter subunit C